MKCLEGGCLPWNTYRCCLRLSNRTTVVCVCWCASRRVSGWADSRRVETVVVPDRLVVGRIAGERDGGETTECHDGGTAIWRGPDCCKRYDVEFAEGATGCVDSAVGIIGHLPF